MLEVLQKVVGESKQNASVLIVLAASLYVGKMQVDQLALELSEVKAEQKQISRLLTEHSITWAQIAERVKILKEKN